YQHAKRQNSARARSGHSQCGASRKNSDHDDSARCARQRQRDPIVAKAQGPGAQFTGIPRLNAEIRLANDETNLNDRNDECTTFDSVIPSEAENGATGGAATWTGRPEAERTGSERIKSLINH